MRQLNWALFCCGEHRAGETLPEKTVQAMVNQSELYNLQHPIDKFGVYRDVIKGERRVAPEAREPGERRLPVPTARAAQPASPICDAPLLQLPPCCSLRGSFASESPTWGPSCPTRLRS